MWDRTQEERTSERGIRLHSLMGLFPWEHWVDSALFGVGVTEYYWKVHGGMWYLPLDEWALLKKACTLRIELQMWISNSWRHLPVGLGKSFLPSLFLTEDEATLCSGCWLPGTPALCRVFAPVLSRVQGWYPTCWYHSRFRCWSHTCSGHCG